MLEWQIHQEPGHSRFSLPNTNTWVSSCRSRWGQRNSRRSKAPGYWNQDFGALLLCLGLTCTKPLWFTALLFLGLLVLRCSTLFSDQYVSSYTVISESVYYSRTTDSFSERSGDVGRGCDSGIIKKKSSCLIFVFKKVYSLLRPQHGFKG